MLQGKEVLGIIPARGGSKRLPRKNLLPLAGRPLIAHTIEAGLRSPYIDELVVSTDDPEIAEIARSLGAQVPFLRPAELARDTSGNFELIEHALFFYRQSQHREFSHVVYLQPTSPLRDSGEIDRAVQLLKERQADAVISVSEPDHSPLWCNTLPGDLSMKGFLREDVKYQRSQDLERYYRLNGAIYLISTARLLAERTFFISDNIYAHVMPPEKSVDVDTLIDLKLCEILLQNRTGQER